MTLNSNSMLLRSAGIISLLIALFQAIISFSSEWSLYFGAPLELTNNPILLIVSGLLVSIIFIVFGLYALSGTGDMRPLPFLRSGLIIIGGIYTLRGFIIILELLVFFNVININDKVTLVSIMSSFVSLLIGIIYLIGTFKNWSGLTQLAITN
jgi:hypothetical protein